MGRLGLSKTADMEQNTLAKELGVRLKVVADAMQQGWQSVKQAISTKCMADLQTAMVETNKIIKDFQKYQRLAEAMLTGADEDDTKVAKKAKK